MKTYWMLALLINIVIFPFPAFANLDLITWKGTYYDAIPNKKGITAQYCKEHTPGSFIHVVKEALSHPVYTDKGIKLDRATFFSEQKHGFYLLHGDFWATKKNKQTVWQDHIYYFLTKLTEAGRSEGVWSSPECKGFYYGVAVQDKTKNRKEWV